MFCCSRSRKEKQKLIKQEQKKPKNEKQTTKEKQVPVSNAANGYDYYVINNARQTLPDRIVPQSGEYEGTISHGIYSRTCHVTIKFTVKKVKNKPDDEQITYKISGKGTDDRGSFSFKKGKCRVGNIIDLQFKQKYQSSDGFPSVLFTGTIDVTNSCVLHGTWSIEKSNHSDASNGTWSLRYTPNTDLIPPVPQHHPDKDLSINTPLLSDPQPCIPIDLEKQTTGGINLNKHIDLTKIESPPHKPAGINLSKPIDLTKL
jgi:hypothetical protein